MPKEVPKNVIGKVMRRILQENDPMWDNFFLTKSSHAKIPIACNIL